MQPGWIGLDSSVPSSLLSSKKTWTWMSAVRASEAANANVAKIEKTSHKDGFTDWIHLRRKDGGCFHHCTQIMLMLALTAVQENIYKIPHKTKMCIFLKKIKRLKRFLLQSVTHFQYTYFHIDTDWTTLVLRFLSNWIHHLSLNGGDMHGDTRTVTYTIGPMLKWREAWLYLSCCWRFNELWTI